LGNDEEALRSTLQSLPWKQPKIESSEQIASLLFPNTSVKHIGELIRYWAQFFVKNGILPEEKQVKFVKKKTLMRDEDVQAVLRRFIRTEPQVSLISTRLTE
jgi:hypothetical protein